MVVLDGLFSQDDDGSLHFHEATHLTASDSERLQRTVQRRVLRHFVRRGLLDDYAAQDMLTWQTAGGFSIDASVRVAGSDRAGRERLLRYCARPPFALERLHIERRCSTDDSDNGTSTDVRRVVYRLPRPTPDGRTVLSLSPLEFLDALARLIPPPRVHRQRYHGVLAPHAQLRHRITAWARQAAHQENAHEPARFTPPQASTALAIPTSSPSPETGGDTPPSSKTILPRAQNPTAAASSPACSRWARLLARVYEVLPLRCPACGADMRILAFLTQPEPIHHQTPAFDPADPEPLPKFDYDQSFER